MKLTPSFHPISGIAPITDMVIQQMVRVASTPIIMLCVAMVRIGSDIQIPITKPLIAESDRS